MDFANKKEAREILLAKRLAIPEDIKNRSDCELFKAITRLPEYINADTILLYVPFRGEPDLSGVVMLALLQRKKVALPISNTETLTLTFKQVSFKETLYEGAYGILEPSANAKDAVITEKTLCIVPALSFDMRGYRLGYGKGYYDRFLADFPGVSVGAVYESLLTHELPTNATDIPVDIVITETGVLYTNEILKKERGER